MRNTDIKKWILADLTLAPSNYYKLLARSPPNVPPDRLWNCLQSLTKSGKIYPHANTPNPTYTLCAPKPTPKSSACPTVVPTLESPVDTPHPS